MHSAWQCPWAPPRPGHVQSRRCPGFARRERVLSDLAGGAVRACDHRVVRTIVTGLAILAVVALGGCECAYGGPGCGVPGVFGLCEPIVRVGVPVEIEVQYGDDTGSHPAATVVTRVFSPKTIAAWPGVSTGSIHVLGLAVGTSDVEFDVEGWDRKGLVPFAVIAEEPPSCMVDPHADGPAFDMPLAR